MPLDTRTPVTANIAALELNPSAALSRLEPVVIDSLYGAVGAAGSTRHTSPSDLT